MRQTTERQPPEIPRSFLVMGAEAGVGTTFACCALLALLRAQGVNGVGMTTGAADDPAQVLAAQRLARAGAFDLPARAIRPMAMPSGRGATGRGSPQRALHDTYDVLATWADVIVVDGSGPSSARSVSAFAQAQSLPAVLVVRLDPGCRHAALRMVQRLRARGVTVVGWVANTPAASLLGGARQRAAEQESVQSALGMPCLGVLRRRREPLHDDARAKLLSAAKVMSALGAHRAHNQIAQACR